MFGKVISSPAKEDRNTLLQKNRQHARRPDDRCVSIINGQMHPVENWSNGGMMISADERLFGIGQECVFTLKFKLRDEIMEIDHKAKIIRKAPSKVALQFLPLSKVVQSKFQQVVDDYVSQRFAESQS
tara:strand:+ start:14260 stop:14643 length:384 start_codon:yes stop_codon:yes gene_type:complete